MTDNERMEPLNEQNAPKAGSGEPLLSIRNLDVVFGKGKRAFKAVSDVSFDIYRGETVSLVGESGSGKTTIGRAIVRINRCSAGEIWYDGQKISGKL